MTRHDDRVYVALIRDAARAAAERVADMTRDDYLTSEGARAAVSLNVIRIVERVPKVSRDYRTLHPECDWDAIGALRTRIEPEFHQRDAAEEWEVVATVLPDLATRCDALLPSNPPWLGSGPADEAEAEVTPPRNRAAARDAAPLAIPHDELRGLCERLRVTRLRMFGSALRSDFGPESDVDLLVEYAPGTRHPWGGVSLGDEFSPLFAGHPVELIDREHLSPYTRDQILAEAVEIFPVDHRNLEKAS